MQAARGRQQGRSCESAGSRSDGCLGTQVEQGSRTAGEGKRHLYLFPALCPLQLAMSRFVPLSWPARHEPELHLF
jgi:hypothetical protein